jgi:cell wall-associated NlpC family hydrolase
VQAKLTVSQPGDAYEQEADHVAEQVMRMPVPCADCADKEMAQAKPLGAQITPLVQRQTEEEEEEPVQRQAGPEEEEEEPVQAKASGGGASRVDSGLETGIQALKGGGQPLSDSARRFFEPRFGADFSQVRVHADDQATRQTQALNARAFTLGQDIVMAPSQFAPETETGRMLLAHELTHVIQQRKEPFTQLQRRCGETTPPQENYATIRAEIVSQTLSQIGEHYLWSAEGERPGLGDVVMDRYYQGVARISNGCVCAGKHSDPVVSTLPRMNQTVSEADLGAYCATYAFLRQEGAGNCGGGCGATAGTDIFGECCVGHRHFDCSGFVHWCYNQAGYNINRLTVSGYQACDRNIQQADLQPGDLCYIGNHHVGIFIGNGLVMEARAHNYGVVLTAFSGRGWTSYGSLF